MSDLKYDKKDKYSIEKYGQEMVGKTFKEIIDLDVSDSIIREPEPAYGTDETKGINKGKLGELVEKHFFHYEPNSNPEPDFPEAGVELKVTPYKKNKNKTLSAKERLVLNMIDYNSVVDELGFETSHFWHKNKLILLVYYLHEDGQNKINLKVNYVRLFTPQDKDLEIIKQDYQKIVKKIQDGKAHELSEADTTYLSACTKGANSSKRRAQPNSDILAKPRAFAFKQGFMTYVLNELIIGKKPKYESIIKDDLKTDFEKFIMDKIGANAGKSVEELCELYDLDSSKEFKDIQAKITFRMLGVKSNKAEEFEKAGIQIKSIRIERNGQIKENMSFPTFKFKEIIKQEWDESDLRNMFLETKYLFVVYQQREDEKYYLDHAQFWNMPISDLDSEVKRVWEKTVNTIKKGVVITRKNGKHYNDLPNPSESPICHVRPHASKSYYKIGDYEVGKQINGDELPDGRWMTKQCFWLNKEYIVSIIKNK